MQLPPALKAALDERLDLADLDDLRRSGERLSTRYRAETRDGHAHLSNEAAVRAYLAARLPATFAAASASLSAAAERLPDFAPATLLDVGAGPGTVAWAAATIFPTLRRATLVEASRPVAEMGEALAAVGLAAAGAEETAATGAAPAEIGRGTPGLVIDWRIGRAMETLGDCPPADLATLSYVLDELAGSERAALVEALWTRTKGALVIVEPGTPAGWQRLLTVRDVMLEAGAFLAAPCPHAAACPVIEPDWCHFSQRVERSRVHRLTKNGTVPYEDEKFLYMAFSHRPATATSGRVLAPARQGSGKVRLKLCTADGTVEERLVTKREGGAFRVARRLEWGDAVR